MSKPAKQLGDSGEAFAATYLRGRGFRIIFCNYYTRYGEIDLVAERDGIIHCVEVKTRRGLEFGSVMESVGKLKQQRLWRATHAFIEREHIDVPYQIDLLTLEKNGSRWVIGWHENVIEDDPAD